jgi:hypothetical protein
VPITKSLGDLPTIEVDGIERLLDEIVCWAFHGQPPRGIRACTVLHADRNKWNCAATNLSWHVDADWLARHKQKVTLTLMRPDFLPSRRVPISTPKRRLVMLANDPERQL